MSLSKVTQHLEPAEPTTTAATGSKEVPQTPNPKGITTLSYQAQNLLHSLDRIGADFELLLFNIRIYVLAPSEKQKRFKNLFKNSRLQPEDKELATVQKAIPIVRERLSSVLEKFAEKWAMVEAVMKEERRLRDTVVAVVEAAAEKGPTADTMNFLKKAAEMGERIQKCKDTCRLLASEGKKVKDAFAELVKYEEVMKGEREKAGGAEGSEQV